MPLVRRFLQDLRAQGPRDGHHRGIPRHDPYDIEPRACENAQHVSQHGLRQRGALGPPEDGKESLLGRVEVLHGNGHADHDRALMRICRARATSRAWSVMSTGAISGWTPASRTAWA